MNKKLILIIIAYAFLYIIWGTTYFFIKVAVETIPPLLLMASRWFIAGVVLLFIASVTGNLKPLPSVKEVVMSVLMGFLLLFVCNGLVTVAEQTVDSYLVALILACCPIVVVFFDRVLWKKTVPRIVLAGMLLGIAGIGLLLYQGKPFADTFSPEILMVIGALVCWSFGTSIGHRMKSARNIVVNTAIQMLGVGILCSILVLVINPSLLSSYSGFSARSVAAFFYLSLFGSTGFLAYVFLIKNEPAVRVSSHTLVNPVIAVLVGLVIGNEQPVPYLYVSLPLILTGLFLLLYGRNLAGNRSY